MSIQEQFDVQLTPNARQIWHWAIKGYGGVTTILERLVQAGMPIDDDHLELLKTEVMRLAQVCKTLDELKKGV